MKLSDKIPKKVVKDDLKELAMKAGKIKEEPKDIFGDLQKPKNPKQQIVENQKKTKLSEELGMTNPNLVAIIDKKEPPAIPTQQQVQHKQNQLNPNSITEYPMQLKETYDDLPEIIKPQYYPKEVISESVDLMRFLVQKIIKKSDFQPIGDNKFLKRSGYNKIAQAYGITTKKIKEIEIYTNELGALSAKAWVRATLGEVKYQDGLRLLLEYKQITTEEAFMMIAKLGKVREADGFGEVAMTEIKFEKNKTIHNLKAHAFTRARNRSIADLVGFGVVSAMEVDVNSEAKVDDIFG